MNRTPLHIATERGNTSIIEMLVDLYRADVSARTSDGSTLIHIASQFGYLEAALAFIKRGVPLHMPNKVGWFGVLHVHYLNGTDFIQTAFAVDDVMTGWMLLVGRSYLSSHRRQERTR